MSRIAILSDEPIGLRGAIDTAALRRRVLALSVGLRDGLQGTLRTLRQFLAMWYL